MNHQQLQITLPTETIRLIEQMIADCRASEKDLSQLINEAVKFYASHKQKTMLREQVIAGAISRAERDLNLAQDWLFLEEAVCKDL